MHKICLGAVVCALGIGTATVEAQSQPVPKMQEDGYFAPFFLLGVGGSVSTSSADATISLPGGGTISGATNNVSASNNLLPSFGGGARYMFALHRYFALGPELALSTWQSRGGDSANVDRNLTFDASVVPQGRLPITSAIELYLAVPVGLSIDFWNGPMLTVTNVATVDTSDTAVGFNLSLLFGARFALTRGFGLFGEVGYMLHSFSHEIRAGALGINANVNAHLTLEQLALRVGAYF